jgi:predicted transcriptional regulator
MSSILERSGLGWLVSEAEKKLRAVQAAAVPVNQDEQELALALSGAHILALLQDIPSHQASVLEMRRMISRPVKELILAIDRMVQLGLIEYGEGDLVRLSELGVKLA